jgi:hypothetical protein
VKEVTVGEQPDSSSTPSDAAATLKTTMLVIEEGGEEVKD